VVAVAVAAACAPADAVVVVVGDVECCGGGVEARDRCADRERREEDEEDDDVEDVVDDAAAADDDRYLDETCLLERAGFRNGAVFGLSSAGVSGGREEWAGSGAVAAVAAATMPSRGAAAGRRSGYARRSRANAGPRGSSSAACAAAPSPGTPAAAGGLRIDDAPATCEHEGKQCYSLRG
jgi:hypothetical protein